MKKGDRKALIKLRGNKCEECGLGSIWNGKPLTLQVHGHKTNNPRVVCPNCHTQTDDWCGKKSGGKKFFSEETRKKISEALKGRKFSEETRKKISIAVKTKNELKRVEAVMGDTKRL